MTFLIAYVRKGETTFLYKKSLLLVNHARRSKPFQKCQFIFADAEIGIFKEALKLG